MDINWFPGHMTKARRMIESDIKLVDVVVELLDARIPRSSANPLLDEITEKKPKVIALNKADLADPQCTKEWINYYQQQQIPVTPLDAVGGKGLKELINKIEQAASAKIRSLTNKGIKQRPVRAMIIGIPNVGKSSLINRLLGTATVKTGDKPGVTRGKQWIKISKNLELLDTPGVLWPKLDSSEIAYRLAVTGAIKDDVFDVEKVTLKLVDYLRSNYPAKLAGRYKISGELATEPVEIVKEIGKRRGCLRAGGIVDLEKAIRIILSDFRSGKLGTFTLDNPNDN